MTPVGLEWLQSFWLCFVPLFVAVDPIGLLPLFLHLTEGLGKERIRKVVWESVITALAVALAFIAVGTGIFRLLQIRVADFMIAGGTLLFLLSLREILLAEKGRFELDADGIGAVPIGVPLITGPAVLTTSLLLISEHSAAVTSLALAANIFLTGVVFLWAPWIHRVLGKTGIKALSKIIALLLAAIGVMVVRRGLAIFVTEGLHF